MLATRAKHCQAATSYQKTQKWYRIAVSDSVSWSAFEGQKRADVETVCLAAERVPLLLVDTMSVLAIEFDKERRASFVWYAYL